MAKANDTVKAESKKPEEMSSQELEELIAKGPDATGEKLEEGVTLEKVEEVVKEEKQETKEVKVEEKKEELIAGKFKTNDELIKAYTEAEKKISQQGEESSKAKKQAELLKQQLSQVYNLDSEGNILGARQVAPQIPQTQDQLAGIRDYFPGYTDEQITALIGLNGLMINSALSKFREEYDKNLEPVYEIKFEREVEKQRRQMKDKYSDFAELENDVNEKLSKLPTSLRAKDGSVETIFLTVRGEKLPEFIEKAKQGVLQDKTSRETKSEDAFVESSGKTHVPTPPLDMDKLSSRELEDVINRLSRK